MMNKQEFLRLLKKGLRDLPKKEREERLAFYSEIIDDRIEDGLSEDETVGELDSVEAIVEQILREMPCKKKNKHNLKPLEIVLIILGAPLWLPLLLAFLAVLLSLYVSWWAVVISLWSIFGSLVGCGFGGIITGLFFAVKSGALTGVALIGLSLFCLGISIFSFFAFKKVTDWTLYLTKRFFLWLKSQLFPKGEVK